ncbi:type II secretion system F family protein [bacterium]|nr:type II secretion system F family protein [bacterium]
MSWKIRHKTALDKLGGEPVWGEKLFSSEGCSLWQEDSIPKFLYEALDAKGRVVQGEVDAPNTDTVIQDLRRVRYTVTHIKEKPAGTSAVMAVLDRLQTVSVYALAVFTRQLATLLQSGVPLTRSLEALMEQSVDPKVTRAVGVINKDVKEGIPMSRAMMKQSHVFSPIYVSMVRAGEISGAMDEILDRLAGYLEREFELRRRISSATIYPMLVFIISIGITVLLTNFVFPTFIELFRGINITLPWSTRALITITHFLRNPAVMVPIVVGLVVGFFALRSYIKTPLGRRQFSWIQLELPVIGKIYHKVALVRFCRTLSTMLDSGIPLLHGLKTTAFAMDNAVMADLLEDVAQSLKAGVSLSLPMEDYHQFPTLLTQMVRVGEESGELATMLRKMGDFYDMDVEAALEGLVAILEPCMILAMGILVAFVLLAVFTPVYTLVQQF